MADPLIFANPELGLTESTVDGKDIDDQRTANRGYPYSSQTNLPVDDAHRHNQMLRMLDEDFQAIEDASLLGLPVYLLLPER